jgi:hypothetical protein
MIYAIRTKRKRREGINDEQAGPVQHILGAIGEQALAQHLGVFWSGTVGTVHASADVAGCYQVRATERASGRLIAHDDDNDLQPFILARVMLPEVHLVGWLWGHEAKLAKFWRADVPHPAYFAWPVHDMATLPNEAEVKAYRRPTAA